MNRSLDCSLTSLGFSRCVADHEPFELHVSHRRPGTSWEPLTLTRDQEYIIVYNGYVINGV
jgi:hypothetical protein